jgi:hypothetical protein
MESATTARSYVVTGDPGAVFTLTVINEDAHHYNFPENTNPSISTLPAPAFSATTTNLKNAVIGANGTYEGTIIFPSVTDDDHYDISLIALAHHDTILSDNLGGGYHYFLPRITRFLNTTVTFSLSSAGSSGTYNTLPSNYTSSGIDSNVNAPQSPTKFSISWAVSLSSSDFVIARQPLDSDFEFTTTKDTLTAGSGTSLELKDITGLSIGMGVSGTGIATDAVISDIKQGFKDANNSTALNEVYRVPLVPNDDETDLEPSTGGTVILSASSTFVADRTLTFTGKGSKASKKFNNTDFRLKNLKVTIDDVVTTTDAAVDNSTTIPITSTNGIKAAEGVTMSGIGIVGTPHVDAVSAGVNVTASAAQTIENGQTITFTGSSRNATITADVEVLSHGDSNITLTLALDNILTVS